MKNNLKKIVILALFSLMVLHLQGTYLMYYIEALPQLCMKNIAQGGVWRDKYSGIRGNRVLYVSRYTLLPL